MTGTTKSECEMLHDIAVSILQNSKVNVIMDNQLPTAMTDYKNISAISAFNVSTHNLVVTSLNSCSL